MTPRERRRRLVLLGILVLLLALLSYATYYFIQNRRLPIIEVAPSRTAIQPPQFLYAITGGGANELKRPVGVAVADDGRVYTVDFGNRRISAFTNNGRYLFSFNKTDKDVLGNPVHIWIENDELWVTDRRNKAIFVYDLEGKFKRRFEPKNEKLSWTPLAIAFSADGELRVTDVGSSLEHRLLYFSKEGSRTVSVGSTHQAVSLDDTPGGFYFPNGLAVADDGRVFVSDGDNRRIQVFGKTGEFEAFVDTSGVPRGIAIDDQQRLYVVDAVAHTIDVYDLEGERLTQFGGQGFGPGQFNYPNDIALDQRGRIYITDRDNNQVQVWGWAVAQPPAIAAPTSLLGWLACLSPFLLLPLLLLLRKTHIVVTPDFVEALIASGDLAAVAKRRRLRLIAPEEDSPLYEGRVVDGIDLSRLISLEAHSESDARAIADKLEVGERESVLFAMASRAKALATEDRQIRRNAILAEVRAIDFDTFRRDYLQG